MKLRDYSYANAFIKFDHASLSLDCYGIYLVTGDNGAGKSTLLKSIVFGNEDIKFANAEQEIAYLCNRGALLAYVPQDVPSPHIRVSEFLDKGNGTIEEEAVSAYLRALGLGSLDLRMYVNQVSGGERTKLCIVAALLKDCPYLILDEPTNNLDDESVERLCELLESYAHEHTVVVVTHDDRVSFETPGRVEIEAGRILSNTAGSGRLNEASPSDFITPPGLAKSMRWSSSVLGWLSRCVAMFVVLGMLMLNVSLIEPDYYRNYQKDADLICIYDAGSPDEGAFGDFNEAYFQAAQLDSNAPNVGSMFSLRDVPALARTQQVKDIYVADFVASLDLMDYEPQGKSDVAANDLDADSIPVAAVPGLVLGNFGDETGDGALFVLQQGRAPVDEAKEIALSGRAVATLYGIDDPETLIGTEVKFHGELYTMVGVNMYDFAWVSYSANENNGYYHYTPESFPRFLAANEKAWNENGYGGPLFAPVTIVTQPGCERQVLDYLMQNYSRSYYYSQVYDQLGVAQMNLNLMNGLLPLNIGVSILIAAFLVFIMRHVFKEDMRRLRDYGNYYLRPGSLGRRYLLAASIMSLLAALVAIGIGVVATISTYPELLIPLVADAAIVFAALLVVPIVGIVSAGRTVS